MRSKSIARSDSRCPNPKLKRKHTSQLESLNLSYEEQLRLNNSYKQVPLAYEKYSLAVCSDLCLKSVLICDDEAFNLMTLNAMLSDLDVEAECLESGVLAVNRFRFRLSLKCCSRTYRLVMTDISMPVMDGFEVCQQIM